MFYLPARQAPGLQTELAEVDALLRNDAQSKQLAEGLDGGTLTLDGL